MPMLNRAAISALIHASSHMGHASITYGSANWTVTGALPETLIGSSVTLTMSDDPGIVSRRAVASPMSSIGGLATCTRLTPNGLPSGLLTDQLALTSAIILN